MNAEESAARFLTERGGNALCLCADDSAAALLRGTIAQTADAPIKLQVISWRQLCAAANALPENQPPDKLFAAAALLPSAGGRWQLNAKIYAQLSAAQKENGGMRLADSLAQLFEEMQECGVFDKPAADKLSLDGNFAYQAKLLDDVRRALAKETDDKELITIAKTLTQPLLFVCANDIAPTPAQRRFIDNAQNAKVFCGNPSAEEKHLREVLSADGAKTPGDITCRHLADYAALSLADAARAALMVVRDFLENENQHCGNPKIGIVVYDRLLARRLRALAENDGILIADRAGWRAATLSCGAALATAAAAVAAPFDTADAESLLQPPFWQALKDEQHNAMLEEWREVLDSAKALPESWGEVATLCAEGSALQQAARRFDIGGRESMTTGEWLRFLRDTFAPLLSGYDEDKAALEMFARLQTAGGDSAMCAGEFCAWLNLFLRDESFAGDDIDSPVVFVPPQVNTSAYDKLLLLGANGKTLPTIGGGVFGERLRVELGLPSRREMFAKQRDNFCRLVAKRTSITAVWCADDDESPFWALFAAQVKQCGGKVENLQPPGELIEIAAADIPVQLPPQAIVRTIPKSNNLS